MLHKRITLLHLLSLCILFSAIRTAASVPGQGKPVVTILSQPQVEIQNKIDELNQYIELANQLNIPSRPTMQSTPSQGRNPGIMQITPIHCVATATYQQFQQEIQKNSKTQEQLNALTK